MTHCHDPIVARREARYSEFTKVVCRCVANLSESERTCFVGTLEGRHLEVGLRFPGRVQNPPRDNCTFLQCDPKLQVFVVRIDCEPVRWPISEDVWVRGEAGLLDVEDVLRGFDAVKRENAIRIGYRLTRATPERSSRNIDDHRQRDTPAADRCSRDRVGYRSRYTAAGR